MDKYQKGRVYAIVFSITLCGAVFLLVTLASLSALYFPRFNLHLGYVEASAAWAASFLNSDSMFLAYIPFFFLPIIVFFIGWSEYWHRWPRWASYTCRGLSELAFLSAWALFWAGLNVKYGHLAISISFMLLILYWVFAGPGEPQKLKRGTKTTQ